MKKKLLSILTASAMAVSAAAALQLSAAAFTLNSTYDEVKINNNFNTESNTGAPDGTNYKISGTDGDCIWDASSGIDISKNYYLSLDFKAGEATGTLIKITNKGKNYPDGDVGPSITLTNNTLYNVYGSKNEQKQSIITKFDTSKWYKIEFEGRMKVSGCNTTLTLYEYDDSGKTTQVGKIEDLGLRNFDEGNTKTYGYTRLASNLCYDNEYAVQEWPNSVTITEAENRSEVQGGEDLSFSAVATINGTSDNVTQPKITWSLSEVKEGEEGYIEIADGRLTVNALASDQNIKVIATASSNGNPSAEYSVAVKKRDLGYELFDAITITGAESIDSGSSVDYTYTATKNGTEVTNLTAEDVVWSIYDSTGARLLGNKYITVDNGKLTVDKSVLGQNIRVRAATSDGYVYSEKDVTINTVSKESVILANACEEKVSDSANIIQGSWDGSSYYTRNTSNDFMTSGTLGTNSSGGDILISADIKFLANGAGFETIRRDGGIGLQIANHNGKFATQIGGSDYSDTTYEISAEKWYHIDLMFDQSNSSVNIWEYDDQGNRTNKGTFANLTFRNSNPFNRIRLFGNTGIDNYIAVYPRADQITVVPDDDTVAAGSSINATITASRDGLGMARISNSAVTWSVYDSNNQYPIATDDVTVTAGVVTVSAMAVPQTFYLRATSIYDNSVYGYARMTTTAGKQFEITNIGVDSVDERQLVRIYANKLTDYKDDVVFLMTFYDENGKLVGAYSKKANAKNLAQGENEIVIDYTLPEAYNKETGAAKVMAWTSLTTNEEPEGISGSFSASYANGTVTLSNAPSVSGTTTVAVFDSKNEAVYEAQSDTEVTTINVGTLEAGTYTLTLGGAVVDGSYVTYKATFEVN